MVVALPGFLVRRETCLLLFVAKWVSIAGKASSQTDDENVICP